jgi:CO/xanthine dehydrogenase Mo-binding subunit
LNTASTSRTGNFTKIRAPLYRGRGQPRQRRIRIIKFCVAHHCGQIINPSGVRAQIDGCAIQTVSRTLKEELTFDRGTLTSLDWTSPHPDISTFPELPEIEIALIDRPPRNRARRRADGCPCRLVDLERRL